VHYPPTSLILPVLGSLWLAGRLCRLDGWPVFKMMQRCVVLTEDNASRESANFLLKRT